MGLRTPFSPGATPRPQKVPRLSPEEGGAEETEEQEQWEEQRWEPWGSEGGWWPTEGDYKQDEVFNDIKEMAAQQQQDIEVVKRQITACDTAVNLVREQATLAYDV
jgi:hypothetical protein